MSGIMFSIIVPCKDSETYLAACLESLLRQEFPAEEREILCVDDGSTDGSVSLIKAYESKDSGVRLLSSSGCGPGAARNLAMSRARGKYILFVDSDDRLASSEVLGFIASEMEGGSLDLLNFGARVEFADEEMKRNRYREEQRYKKRKSAGIFPTGRKLLHELITREDFLGSVWLLCLRRGYVEREGLRFPALSHSEDEVFCLRAFLCAGRSKHSGERLYLRSVRPGSLTASPDDIEAFRERMKAAYLLQEAAFFAEAPWLDGYLARYMQEVCRRFSALPKEQTDKMEGFPPWEVGYFRLMKLCTSLYACAQHSYLFPWHLFRRGERVVIYGAGNVGRDFLRQVQEYGYVKLAGMVDRAGNTTKVHGMEVKYPKELKDMEYDAILLSVQDGKLAEGIQEDLKQLGISEGKIRWDGHHYLRKDFYEGYYFPELAERKESVEG